MKNIPLLKKSFQSHLKSIAVLLFCLALLLPTTASAAPTVTIVDLQAEAPDFDLETYLKELQPDIVGVTAVTQFINMAMDYRNIK